MIRVLVAEVGAGLARLTHLDASFEGKGQGRVSVGMWNMDKDACVGRRIGSRPGQVDTFGCKLFGEGERDVFRHAIVTWKIMRVLIAEVGADLARLTPLDASFEGKLPGTCFGGHVMV